MSVPGFTLAGLSEPLAVLVVTGLFAVTPREDPAFLPLLVSMLSPMAMHAVYWTVTHPINKAWAGILGAQGLEVPELDLWGYAESAGLARELQT